MINDYHNSYLPFVLRDNPIRIIMLTFISVEEFMKKQTYFKFLSLILLLVLIISCSTTSKQVNTISEEERLKQIELENERIAQEKEKEKEKLKTHFKYDGYWYKKENFPSNIKAIKQISLDNPCFMNNNPYGFEKDVAYSPIIDGSAFQWLTDGCLYDFAGIASNQLYWTCIGYVRIPYDKRNRLFNENLVKFFEYVGTYTYTTTSGGTNTVPVFEVIFYQ